MNMALFGMAFYVPLFLQGVLGASATQAGATMTPFSVGIAAASSLGGLALTALQRYRGLALLGTLLMTLGLVLLTHLTPQATLVAASAAVTTAGVGMGIIFAVMGVVALNAVPPAQMGAGAALVRYVGQIGGLLGVALVGTVVSATLAGALVRHVPRALLGRLAADGVAVTAAPQLLVNPIYRASVTRRAIFAAVGRVPPGPDQARLAATSARQASDLVAEVFGRLRLALADALHQGQVVTVVFAVLALLAAAFLRDRFGDDPPSRGMGGDYDR
jgi:hypothetical protein